MADGNRYRRLTIDEAHVINSMVPRKLEDWEYECSWFLHTWDRPKEEVEEHWNRLVVDFELSRKHEKYSC
jgi:hypothetical protein